MQQNISNKVLGTNLPLPRSYHVLASLSIPEQLWTSWTRKHALQTQSKDSGSYHVVCYESFF